MALHIAPLQSEANSGSLIFEKNVVPSKKPMSMGPGQGIDTISHVNLSLHVREVSHGYHAMHSATIVRRAYTAHQTTKRERLCTLLRFLGCPRTRVCIICRDTAYVVQLVRFQHGSTIVYNSADMIGEASQPVRSSSTLNHPRMQIDPPPCSRPSFSLHMLHLLFAHKFFFGRVLAPSLHPHNLRLSSCRHVDGSMWLEYRSGRLSGRRLTSGLHRERRVQASLADVEFARRWFESTLSVPQPCIPNYSTYTCNIPLLQPNFCRSVYTHMSWAH
ncbi:hypothetical protein B0H21DRAFT_737096 [Amylocystis lapponica]|nr:hypothetical protein B0H21DRAFT_737096 [Amylocystis lapponica]